MSTHTFFGERSHTVVAATFPNRSAAQAAASTLRDVRDLRQGVAVVGPSETHLARKLEPEQRGIWLTLVRSHLLFGALGALAGGLAAVWWVGASPAAAAAPGLTFACLLVFGAFIGMMAAGLFTLRPDHAPVLRRVHAAVAGHQWAVVVRPLSEACTRLAMATLQEHGGRPTRSL